MKDPSVEVMTQSHESFLAGLALYERRADKQYSLVDCISMNVMRQRRIREILTHDRHFEQEGFVRLLDRESF
jgi:predicted nucleic acid-binding protein